MKANEERRLSGDGESDGRSQPGSGRHAKEVRVGEGIAKHTLVGGPGDCQHRSDERTENQPRQPDLEENVRLDLGQAGVDIDPRKGVQHCLAHRPGVESSGANGGTDGGDDQDRDDPDGEGQDTQAGRPGLARDGVSAQLSAV